MAPDPDPAAAQSPRPRPALRSCLSVTGVVGLLAVLIALTGLAARSYQVEEQIIGGWDTGAFDEQAARAAAESGHFRWESALGVVGLAWERHSWADNQLLPQDFEAVRTDQARRGWSLRHETTTGAIRPLGRNRQDVGPLQSLRWEHWAGPSRVVKAAGFGMTERWGIVVPYWLLIVPGFGPLAWWFWCPPGRAVPRLTIGRLAVVTATLGLILGGLTACGRGSSSERALAVIAKFGGIWDYGPDPGGSGRSVVTRIAFAKTLGSRLITDQEMPRISAALAEFPHLQSLQINARGTKLTGAGVALLADHLDLAVLDLGGLPVNDALLAHLRHARQLQSLNIAWTEVTDAGLAHLGQLPALKTLSLNGLAISDSGVRHLAPLPRLRLLNLSSTGPEGQITDAAVRHLFDSIPTLEEIRTTENYRLGRDQVVTRLSLRKSARPDPGRIRVHLN